MAIIQIQIPNDKLPGVIDAFATQYNYQENIPDPNNPGQVISNPTTRAQFARNCINSFIKQVYVANAVKAIDTQRHAAITTANAELSDVTVT